MSHCNLSINIRLLYGCQTATIVSHAMKSTKSTYIYGNKFLKTRQVRHHKGEAITLYRVYNDVMIMVSKRYDA